MLINCRSLSPLRNLTVLTLGKLLKSAVTAVCNGPELLSSAPDKAKLFAEILVDNFHVDDSGISTCFLF